MWKIKKPYTVNELSIPKKLGSVDKNLGSYRLPYIICLKGVLRDTVSSFYHVKHDKTPKIKWHNVILSLCFIILTD